MSCFLSFEGIDGCGKTTQLGLLANRLREAQREVVVTREPGGTELAEVIRQYLLHSAQPLGTHTELLLFGAARAQHVVEVIAPALQRSAYVLSDRFADSSLAYQGAGLGLPSDFIKQMNGFATNGIEPDLTLVFDIDPLLGQKRRAALREDRIEARGLQFQTKVREGFLCIARQNARRVVVLDAALPPEAIHQQVMRLLHERHLLPDGFFL